MKLTDKEVEEILNREFPRGTWLEKNNFGYFKVAKTGSLGEREYQELSKEQYNYFMKLHKRLMKIRYK